MEILKQTPSQTVGPFFAYGLTPEQYNYDFKQLTNNDLTLDGEESIEIIGNVYDGAGDIIPDAMIELWYNDGHIQRFGRFGTGTDLQNRFIFKTPVPVSVNGQAPYINVIVFMRGQLIHSYTRIYFDEYLKLNETDAVLNSIPEDRKQTLIAHKSGNRYIFNIYMQGQKETVFFEI